MGKVIILFLMSFLVFQFGCARVPLARIGQPVQTTSSLKNEEADLYQWDFGQITQGAIVKHDFILKNSTSKILAINNIHSSCGCTVSKSEKKSLLPQESTLITVSFNSQGYQGPVTQFVYVNTDNADLPIIRFTVKAEVIKED